MYRASVSLRTVEASKLANAGCQNKYSCSSALAVAKTTKLGDPPQVRVDPMVPTLSRLKQNEIRFLGAARSLLRRQTQMVVISHGQKDNKIDHGVWFSLGFSMYLCLA